MTDARVSNAVDTGLMLLRIGIGVMFILHGLPKLTGGQAAWTTVGKAVGVFGITFAPTAWGFMAAFSEAIGGLFLVLGVFVRPFSFLMLCVMVVATSMHVSQNADFATVSHPIEAGIVFLALMVAGGGDFGLGHIVMPLRNTWYQ